MMRRWNEFGRPNIIGKLRLAPFSALLPTAGGSRCAIGGFVRPSPRLCLLGCTLVGSVHRCRG